MEKIDFEKGSGLVPAVVQDSVTRRVLMVAYMNEEALEETKRLGKATFYSRSKRRLWTKGESSGNELLVKEIKVDCDGDTLLVLVEPTGPACHTGADTCFQEVNQDEFALLSELEATIRKRRAEPTEGSYTQQLFEAGINRIAQKVGEEAVEVILAAKDDNQQEFLGECADLVFHLLVLLNEKQVELSDVLDVLRKRRA